MKKILLLLLAPVIIGGMFFDARAQTPCCSIVSINTKNNIVFFRNNNTGHLMKFKADALDIRGVRIGDAISANEQAKKIQAIIGVTRNYAAMEPVPGDPCCPGDMGNHYGVNDISPDAAQSCCNIVTASMFGNLIRCSVPKNLCTDLDLHITQSVQKWDVVDTGFTLNRMPVNKDEPVNSLMINSARPVLSYFLISHLDIHDYKGFFIYPLLTNASANMEPEKTNLPAPSNEEKWVISNASIKGATGKISVTLPGEADYEILIYDPSDNKFLGSFKKGDEIILFPGIYKVKISNAEVNDVTVQQGMETRLKAGILSLVSPAEFKLYDKTQRNFIGYYKSSEKIGLPVGTYQLSLNGRFRQIIIKDGETIEF